MARIARACVGWACANARNPSISAGEYGFFARSRDSGASAASRCGTTQRARNRRLVRSVRRAADEIAGACAANRSITDGCSSTSGTGSIPSGIAQAASLDAAHSRHFARSRVPGAEAATTVLANPAAASGVPFAGFHRARQEATSPSIR